MSPDHPLLLWSVPLFMVVLAGGTALRGLRAARLERYLRSGPGPQFWVEPPGSGRPPGRWLLRSLLMAAAGGVLAWTLSAPSLGSREVPVPAPSLPLVVVLDVSRSMDVGDVPLGRMGAARILVRRIVEEIGDLPLGLVLFAGDAHGVLPPTTDRGLLLGYLSAADPGVMSHQGTSVPRALQVARDLMEGEGGIILLSDGEDHQDPEASLALAREVARGGGWVSTVSLGTEAGGPLPAREGPGGALMISPPGAETGEGSPRSRARPAFLASLAREGGGVSTLQENPRDVARLLAWLRDWARSQEVGVVLEEVPVEGWPWLLALAVSALLGEALLDPASRGKETARWS